MFLVSCGVYWRMNVSVVNILQIFVVCGGNDVLMGDDFGRWILM